MVRTFAAPFDFHFPHGGRRQFNQLATMLSPRFDQSPAIVDEPIFSYGVTGKSQLHRIADLSESQPAIVYLSNVVMHSSILVVGEFDATGLESPLQYESLRVFFDDPYVKGYVTESREGYRTSFDEKDIVISELCYFRNEDYEIPNNEIFRVLNNKGDAFVCHVLDFVEFFSHSGSDSRPHFVLPSTAKVDLDACIEQYLKFETLREYLLDHSIPFATVGDDHMDDEYAVSYGMDCWRLSDEQIAFVR